MGALSAPTYFGDLLLWVCASAAQQHAAWVDLSIVTACALLTVPLAIRIFRWDGER